MLFFILSWHVISTYPSVSLLSTGPFSFLFTVSLKRAQDTGWTKESFPSCTSSVQYAWAKKSLSILVFLPFAVIMLSACSLPHWSSVPQIQPEWGLCDLQLCLLSTQTSVRTAGRTRQGQTENSKSNKYTVLSKNAHEHVLSNFIGTQRPSVSSVDMDSWSPFPVSAMDRSLKSSCLGWPILGRLGPAPLHSTQPNEHWHLLMFVCTGGMWNCLWIWEEKYAPQTPPSFTPVSHTHTHWKLHLQREMTKHCILNYPIVLIMLPLFLHASWFSGTDSGSHTLHPVLQWHTTINICGWAHAHTHTHTNTPPVHTHFIPLL